MRTSPRIFSVLVGLVGLTAAVPPVAWSSPGPDSSPRAEPSPGPDSSPRAEPSPGPDSSPRPDSSTGPDSSTRPRAEPSPGPNPGSSPGTRPDPRPSPSPASSPSPERPRPAEELTPWAVGVSSEKQKAALVDFELGNAQFKIRHYLEALAAYRRAVRSWDHPAIRFNIAVTLVELDKPVGAISNLALAMKHGPAPLGPKLYGHVETYMKLLKGRLALVRIRCPVPGARVLLDGQQIFVGPGEVQRYLMPESHVATADKPGHVGASRTFFAVPGRLSEIRLRPIPLDQAFETRRRWQQFIPWTVAASGLAVALTAVPLLVKGRADVRDYERWVSTNCPLGCPVSTVPSHVADLPSRGRAYQAASASLAGIGGAVLVAGAVLLGLNRPRLVRRKETLDEPPSPPSRVFRIDVSPTGGATLSVFY